MNDVPRAGAPYVLVISRSIPLHDGAGGMERAAWDLALQLSSEIHLEILTTRVPGRDRSFVADGLRVVTIPRTRPGRYSLRWWRGTAQYVAALENPPEVIFSVSAGGTSVAWSRHSPPCVFQVHGTAWAEVKAALRLRRRWRILRLMRGMLWTILDCFTYRRVAAVVTVGPSVSTALRSWPYSRFAATARLLQISNGIDASAYAADPDERSSVRARYDLDAEDVVVASISRLDRQKGVDVYINAVARANAAGCRVSLLVVGAGPEDSALRAEVSRLRIGERVRFVGQASTQEVRALLAASDLFLFAPRMIRREGCPLAVLEAWASGLPVLTLPDLPNPTGVAGAVRLVGRSDAPTIAAELCSATTAALPRPSFLALQQTLPFSATRYRALLAEFISDPVKALR